MKRGYIHPQNDNDLEHSAALSRTSGLETRNRRLSIIIVFSLILTVIFIIAVIGLTKHNKVTHQYILEIKNTSVTAHHSTAGATLLTNAELANENTTSYHVSSTSSLATTRTTIYDHTSEISFVREEIVKQSSTSADLETNTTSDTYVSATVVSAENITESQNFSYTG